MVDEFRCCACVFVFVFLFLFFFFPLGGGVVVVDVGSWCQFLVEGWWVC